MWLGEAGQGSKLKLAVNAYMSTLIEGVAEALELAGQLGVDPSKLDEAIEGGPLDAPIADAKLYKMEHGDLAPEFPLEWAFKDVDLALAGRRREAAAAGGAVPPVARGRRGRPRPGGCQRRSPGPARSALSWARPVRVEGGTE